MLSLVAILQEGADALAEHIYAMVVRKKRAYRFLILPGYGPCNALPSWQSPRGGLIRSTFWLLLIVHSSACWWDFCQNFGVWGWGGTDCELVGHRSEPGEVTTASWCGISPSSLFGQGMWSPHAWASDWFLISYHVWTLTGNKDQDTTSGVHSYTRFPMGFHWIHSFLSCWFMHNITMKRQTNIIHIMFRW